MKLLIVSDSPRMNTGLGRVVRELAQRWSDRHEIEIAGWFDPTDVKTPPFAQKIHRLPTRELGFEYLEPLCRTGHYDVCLGIGDPWYFGYLGQLQWLWKAQQRTIPWVGYLTIDGDPLPVRFQPFLRAFSQVVACTQYGQHHMEPLLENSIPVIPMGVDAAMFHPLANRMAIRRQVVADDVCMFFADAQNTPRKNLWVLLKAFERMQSQRRCVLYVLTNIDDPAGPVLRDMMWTLTEESRAKIIVSSQYGTLCDAELNALYNMADVLVLPSMNEGFGLPLLQALAVGCYPVGTNYASIPEVLGVFGKTVDPAAYFVSEWGMRCAVLTPETLAQTLTEVHAAWQTQQGFSPWWKAEARKYAEAFTWQRTAEALERVLIDVHAAKEDVDGHEVGAHEVSRGDFLGAVR